MIFKWSEKNYEFIKLYIKLFLNIFNFYQKIVMDGELIFYFYRKESF